MATRILVAAMLTGLAGCKSASEVELTLQGHLESTLEATQTRPLQLAMAWYPSFASSSPASAPGGFVTQSVSYQGAFPLSFTFQVSGPPPAGALYDLSQSGGSGHLAYGVLIAYEDGNGNGSLDTIPADGGLIDDIVGLSVPDPSLPPPAHSFFVVYLDGSLAPDDYFSTYALPQGYSLMQVLYDFGVAPVPSDTRISIPVTRTKALNLYACPQAFNPANYFTTSCGIDPYGGTYRARGYVYSYPDHRMLQAWVYDGTGDITDAGVTLDAEPIPFDGTGQLFRWVSDAPLTGDHTIGFSVAGHPDELVPFTVPAPVTISSPAADQQLRSGQPVAIAWEPSAGTAYYDLYFTTTENTPRWLFHAITTDTAITTPAIEYRGAAKLSVIALAPLAVGSQGSFVTVNSRASVPVTFGP